MPFEYSVHVQFNCAILVSISIAILACLLNNRWVPNQFNKKSILVYQFNLVLVIHSIFYIIEIAATSLEIVVITHHIIAIIIFSMVYSEKHTVSVLLLLPFFMHALYWILDFNETEFLTMYNLVFLYTGISTMVISRINSRDISLTLPLLCLSEVSVNFYHYCIDDGISFCEAGDLIGDAYVSLIAFVLVFSVTYSVSGYYKARALGI